MDEAPSLSSYLVFNTVARNGNLSEAAKELLISQPAVSRSLAKLEAGLSVKLFVRNSRGVRLTSEGEILYEHTRSAFNSLEQAEKALKRINSLGLGTVKMGVSSWLCKPLLTPHLKGIVSAFPHLKIDISLRNSPDIFELVENGDLDLGLINRPASFHRLDHVSLMSMNDIFVASPSYLASLKEQGIKTAGNELIEKSQLLLPKKGSFTRETIDKAFFASSVSPSSVIEMNALDSALDFAVSGLGIAVVPKEFAADKLKSRLLVEVTAPVSTGVHEACLVYEHTQLQRHAVSSLITRITEALEP